MIKHLVALLCIVSLHSLIATAADDLDIPFLSGVAKRVKDGLFDSRYSSINNRLTRAPSDEPTELVEVAKNYLKEFRGRGILTEGESNIRKSLEEFVRLKDVIEDLANKVCSRRSQVALERNDLHTRGYIYKSNLGKDRYAGTVRKLVLQRAEICQDVYLMNAGPQNILEYYNVTLWTAVGDIYTDFVDKLVSHLKKEKKFVPYIIPKEVVNEKLGEAVYYAIIEMAKLRGDRRGDQLKNLTIPREDLWELVDDYIIKNTKVAEWFGGDLFASAAFDKKVAGKDISFSWEKDATFKRRLEFYLFKFFIEKNSSLILHEFKEFLRRHEGGRYKKILYASS